MKHFTSKFALSIMTQIIGHFCIIGSPTVILDAPTGMTSSIWSRLQNELITQNVQVCVYDRAGLGFSDREPKFNMSDPMERAIAGPSPFTTHRMVQDLHRYVGADIMLTF